MNWSYLPEDKDTALVDYAKNNSIEGKCTWQSDTLDYLLSFYNKTTFRRCIDAGANYGFLSVGFSKYFQNVEAFELSSDIRHHLEINVRNTPNIRVHQKGLYDATTPVNFELREQSGASGIIGHGGVTEQVTTLDSFNYDDVDLLKIDVEGAEEHLIRGAKNTIKKCLPIICCEIHCSRDTESLKKRQYIFKFLDSLGYKLVDVRHADLLFIA